MTARISLILLIVVVVGLSTTVASADGPPTNAKKPPVAADAKQPAANPVLVTVSKETTVITKPLRTDGYPDYVAALNEIYGKDITPENNAAVLFWKALGPAPIEAKYRPDYFRMLGMPIPADKGNYFVALDEFFRQHNPAKEPKDVGRLATELSKIDKQLELAVQRPWSSKEFPIFAAWLAANTHSLDLVVEASHRPRYFDPLVGGSNPLLIAVLLPGAQAQRTVARALTARATLLMGEEKTAAAWADLLAVHRLARLAGEGPMLVQALVSVTIDGVACRADQALLQHARLSANDALRMRDDLSKLTPLPKLDEKLDREERFTFLDCVTACARDSQFSISQISSLAGGGGVRPESATQRFTDSVAREAIDWNAILRMGNSWYNRAVEIVRKPDPADRNEAQKKFDSDLRSAMAHAKTWTFATLLDPRQAISERVGCIYVALLLPAVTSMANAGDSATMYFDLTKLAFSLAAYRADHGSYPTRLGDLVPKYAPEIPKDVFSAKELHYKPTDDGYVLYSVGRNGEDDGGKGRDDDTAGNGWDDIVVRVRKAP